MSKARAGTLRISITGPQGSGKTTQAKFLARFLKVPVIMTGDAMREIAKMDSFEGRSAKKSLAHGQLVADEIVAGYVKKKIQGKTYQMGFVMDGYPRALSQLSFFDPHFDQVFYLGISDDIAMQRLLKRGREDDIVPLIKERLKLYHRLTKPLLRLYDKKGILSRVDGTGSIKKVQARIQGSLNG